MLFNSYIFIFLFLPVAFFGYYLLNSYQKVTWSKIWLVGCSLFFYSHWNVIYLPLIVGSMLINYKLSLYLQDRKALFGIPPKALFILGLVANIGLLVYYKYMDFFIQNVNWVTGSDFELWNLALPLAISFFTLQQVAYLVDAYEKLVDEHSFLDYSLFVSFFPQLIAGPIVHHQEMMPQFAKRDNKHIHYENIAKGLLIFSIGLFKKLVIADSLAMWVMEGFDESESLTLIPAWVTSIAYTFQIYFDFSGYADMAIGAALLFNIRLPINFNSPYKATGVIDYWQRWHITLTNFITTYVYTPILRSFPRVTFFKAMIATFLAMFVSGLWHGAGWTFIVWGILHGLALVVNHYWNSSKRKMGTILAWFITFNFINITGIFFRARTLDDAFKILEGMVGLNGVEIPYQLQNSLSSLADMGFKFGEFFTEVSNEMNIFGWIVLAFVVSLCCKNSGQLIDNMKYNYRTVLFNVALFSVAILYLNRVSIFLYFNF